MNSLRRTVVTAMTVLWLTVLVPGIAHAQGANQGEPTPEEQKGYTLPYFFTLAGVLAAVVAVCRPSGRKWDVEVAEEEG